MSDRERWVVYPLLFLALGVAMRDKLTRSVDGLVFLSGNSVRMDLDQGVIQTRVLEADVVRCTRVEVEDGDEVLEVFDGDQMLSLVLAHRPLKASQNARHGAAQLLPLSRVIRLPEGKEPSP